MKFIPKYQTAWGPLELLLQNNKFRKNINWINGGEYYTNWVKRDNYYQYGSVTKNQQKTGTYEHDRNYDKNGAYEDYSWWKGYGDLTNNSEENLKSFFQQYVNRAKASGNPMKWISYLEDYLKDGKWTTFTTVNGRTFKIPQEFRDHYAYDRLGSTAHNTNSGEVYYDSEGNTYKSLPEGYEEFDPESIIYDSENNDDKEKNYKIRNQFRNWKNFYLNQNKITDNIVRFRPIQKKTTYPIDSELTQAKNDVLENINPESNPVDTGNPQETGGSAIKGTPGWLRGVGKVFGGIGKGISDLFKGDGKPISPFWSQFMRTINDNAFNLRNTEQLIRNMDVPLLNYTPVYRQVHGDYIAQQQAQREASRLRTSQPITANQQIQTATDLEGIQKGNQLIEQGNAKDAQMYWNTAEKAFQQSKENAAGWDATANKNKQALSEFNNKIAELRYKAQKDNMQNWDTLLADMERRKWQKWDRDEYLKLQSQEELDNLYDTKTGQGADYEELKALREKMLGETDKAKLAELNKQAGAITDRMSARTIYNRLRRLGMYDESKFKDMFPAYNFGKGGILGHSNGGILAFLQKGGGFGVIAASSAGEGNPYLAQLGKKEKSTTSSSTSSTTSKDETEKTKDKLLTNIAETLKGINGLNSDVNILYQELTNFFDIQRYVGDFIDDPMQYYSMYMRALKRANDIIQSSKDFDAAYKELEAKHNLDSPAIDPNGYVYVGIGKTNKIDKVTPEEYLNNTDKYQLLRNSDVLYLRKNDPNYAFRDKYIQEISHSSTSIEDVYKFIKDILGKVGTDKQSRDTIIQQYGDSAVQGLQELNNLIQQGAVNPETAKIIASLTGTQTEVNTSIESQAERAKLALRTIASLLPRNMQTLLLLHSGNKENVGKLLTSIVFQGLNTDITFKINGITQLDEKGNPKSGTRAGNGSGGGSEEAEDRTLLNIVSGMGGTEDKIRINPGTKAEFSVNVENYNIDGIKAGNLEDALISSKLMTISDSRKIYFGDQLIPSEKLRHIVYRGSGFSRAILPTKEDGSPDFTIFERFDRACQKVRNAGMNPNDATTDQKVAEALGKALKEEKLDNLVLNGIPNLKKVGLFVLADGYGTTKGGIKKTKFVVDASSKVNYQDISELLGGKGPDGKYQEYELDDKTWYLPLESMFDSSYDRIYEGTIYIPINNNKLQASTGSGNKLKRSTAYEYEHEYQDSERSRDNIDYSKIINANDTSADKLLNK